MRRVTPSQFEEMVTALFEFVAGIFLGFIAVTLIAALLYGCVAMWLLMLA